MHADHCTVVTLTDEAEGQDRLDEPRVRGQVAVGILPGRLNRPRSHRAQPSGHLTGLIGQQTRIGERPDALRSRRSAADDQPVVIIGVAADLGEANGTDP